MVEESCYTFGKISLLNYLLLTFAESSFLEINLYKKKWLINWYYNPHKNNIENHLDIISRSLDTHSTKYENVVLLAGFRACVDDEALRTF